MAKAEFLVLSAGLVIAASFALIACVSSPNSGTPTSASPLNAGGIDIAGIDPTVKSGNDFFRYANGTWFRNTEIPPDRSSYGLDAKLAEEAILRTRNLLEETAKSTASSSSDERRGSDCLSAGSRRCRARSRGL